MHLHIAVPEILNTKLFPLLVLFMAYFVVIFDWGYYDLVAESMFQTVDSRSYLAVADWLRGDIDATDYLVKRPLLYPAMLVVAQWFGEFSGPWLLQFALWCFTGWMIHYLVFRITKRSWVALLVLLVYATNVSAILLTINALSETLAIAGMAGLAWSIIDRKRMGNVRFAFFSLLIIALLTVVKPLYLYLIPPFALVLFLSTMNAGNGKRILLYAPLALLPVMAQVLFVHAHSGKWAVSNIGWETYKYYFFAELYAKTNDIEIEEAKRIVAPMSQQEISAYTKANLTKAISIYWLNFEGNINTESSMTHIPVKQEGLGKYMRFVNNVYWVIHLLGLASLFFLLGFHTLKRNWLKLFPLLLLALPLCIVLFTAPITFWQGDRIVLPALPVWLVLYSYVFIEISSIRQLSKHRVYL